MKITVDGETFDFQAENGEEQGMLWSSIKRAHDDFQLKKELKNPTVKRIREELTDKMQALLEAHSGLEFFSWERGNMDTASLYLSLVDNQYWPRGYTKLIAENPWYKIMGSELFKGEVVFGPRKRVWQIDWSNTNLKARGKDMVLDPGNTHEYKLCHVWDQTRLHEIIAKILTSGTDA